MTDFIAYDLKRGARYAKVCHPIKTKDGKWDKSYTYLGRVLDEAKGIYILKVSIRSPDKAGDLFRI